MSYEEFSYRINEPITNEYGKSPITPVLSMLEGKWKAKVIYAIMCLKDASFSQLERFCDGISPAALNSVLKELVSNGLIIKKTKAAKSINYSLTSKGEDLMPVFYEIMNWGLNYK